MSIRLNKAIRELNIGLQTAVEFLEKRNDLGEVRSDLSFKLNDEQYDALVKQFKKDKEVKGLAEKLFAKHPKEKKRPAETKEVVETIATQKQQFKPLGKIDLNNLGKKAEPAKSEAPAPKPEQEPKAAAVSPKTEPERKEEPKKVEEKVNKPAPQPKPQEQPTPEKSEKKQESKPEKPVVSNKPEKKVQSPAKPVPSKPAPVKPPTKPEKK